MSFFLFPGQGSQTPGMCHDFYESSPTARKVMDEAAALSTPGFLESIFTGDAGKLVDTRLAQIALLAVDVAIARHLEAVGQAPSGCAGHSLGEFAALVVAGSLSFEDALKLTQVRARLMSEDVPEGGMVAVVGLSPEKIEEVMPPTLDIANYNAPQQTIISGTLGDLEHIEKTFKDAGARRVMRLEVSGPFHSRHMERASDQFRQALSPVHFETPSTRFISSVTASDESDPEVIRELLAKQIRSPVRWTKVMEHIGPVRAVEVGPGRVLQGLAKRTEGAPRVELAGTLEQANALSTQP